MRKRDELADDTSCLNRAKDDELIFVLLGRDIAAAMTVEFWARKRIELGKNNSSDVQIVDALRWARTVRAERKES